MATQNTNKEVNSLDTLYRPVIKFYSTTSNYGFLSNFFKCKFIVDDTVYHHSEGFFQSHRFLDQHLQEYIAGIEDPLVCKHAAHNIRMEDTELEKWTAGRRIIVMRLALIAKFSSSKYLQEDLLNTGNAILVEDSKTDYFWGIGANGNGKNMLGKLLMETREIFKTIQQI